MEFSNSSGIKSAALPFSDAVRVGDVLYLSGMVGNMPGRDELVPGGLAAETRQALDNIGVVLRENGLGYDAVFKCIVMLADVSRWQEFEDVYVTYFRPGRLPVRTAFGVSGLALGAQIEIECWAHIGGA